MDNKKMLRKGFTLAELLIVVAIIAVLVAVAIPVFTAQLNKAKHATDVANARALYAVLQADFLANGEQTIYYKVYGGNGNLNSTSTAEGRAYSIDAGDGDDGKVEVYNTDDELIETFTFTGVSDINIIDANNEEGTPVAIDVSGSQWGDPVQFGNYNP